MITVMVVRSPDYGDDIAVWDGDTEITNDKTRVHIAYVDAGRGYDYADWIDGIDGELAAVPHVVPRAALASVLADPPGKEYIDNWPEEDR